MRVVEGGAIEQLSRPSAQSSPQGRSEMRTVSARGARLGVLSGGVTQALSVVTTIALARLLRPEDFGLVAAANSVIVIFAALTTIGFGTALVREVHPDHRT